MTEAERGSDAVKSFVAKRRDNWMMWSKKKAQTEDALAVRGDERRDSLRKASGRWQVTCDPKMSEWGNPAHLCVIAH